MSGYYSTPQPLEVEEGRLLARLWRRLPVVLRAILAGWLILAIGQFPPWTAMVANWRLSPRIPWFLLVSALWLWIFWRWLSGDGWPRSTAAFRGYMLSWIERRHGWGVAIGITALLFYLAHLSHAYATLAFLPVFILYSLLLGMLVFYTRSILPSVVLHALGDLVIVPIQYGAVPSPLGANLAPAWLAVAVSGAAALAAFSGLAKITRAIR